MSGDKIPSKCCHTLFPTKSNRPCLGTFKCNVWKLKGMQNCWRSENNCLTPARLSAQAQQNVRVELNVKCFSDLQLWPPACSPLTYKDTYYLIWSPEQGPIGFNLKSKVTTHLSYFTSSQNTPILLNKREIFPEWVWTQCTWQNRQGRQDWAQETQHLGLKMAGLARW